MDAEKEQLKADVADLKARVAKLEQLAYGYELPPVGKKKR